MTKTTKQILSKPVKFSIFEEKTFLVKNPIIFGPKCGEKIGVLNGSFYFLFDKGQSQVS
jgi:hypothetical protein